MRDHPCTQCGGDRIWIDGTPEVLANTSGAEEFLETLRYFSKQANVDMNDIAVGYCLSCREQVLSGPQMTFEGTVDDSND